MFKDKSAVVLNEENFEWNHATAAQLNQCFRDKLHQGISKGYNL